jgi:hypothetical protein
LPVTVTGVDEAAATGAQVEAESVRLLADGAAWVTASVRVMPPPVTVTVPLRLAVPVFAVALTVKLPLPEPLVADVLSQV